MNEQVLKNSLGPLYPLYIDPEVVELLVDAPNKVYVQREADYEDTPITFQSADEIRAIIDNTLALAGVTLSSHKTMADIRLPHQSRFVAVVQPTAVNGPTLAIRKFPSHRLTWKELIGWGSVTQEAVDLLQGAVNHQISILVAGGQNSCKTTVANLMPG